MKKKIWSFIVLLVVAAIYYIIDGDTPKTNNQSNESYDVVIDFPEDRYPETADHIKEAIGDGQSSVCTIERNGAKENRKESLSGIDTKTGYDRDEWPMAMCQEGGSGADVEYIPLSDNRGAGSWVGHQLREYPDGTKVKFVIE